MAASQTFTRRASVAILLLAMGVSCSDDDDPLRPGPSPRADLTWMPVVTAEPLQGIWGADDGTLLAVGPEGGVLRLVGDTWRFESSGTDAQLRAAWGLAANDVYAVGYRKGSSSIVHYDGASWTEILTRPGSEMLGVWGASPTDVFAVGRNHDFTSGHIEHYDGSGWSSVSTSHPLLGVWGASASDVFAVGEQGSILRYDGDSWEPMTVPVSDGLTDIVGFSSTHVLAVGNTGTILRYEGSFWTEMTSPTEDNLVAVWGNDSTETFALGLQGTLLRYDGSEWTIRSGPMVDLFFRDLWGRSGPELYATDHRGSIYRHDGTAWVSIHAPPTTEALYAVAGHGADVFAVGFGGAILRGMDEGWESMDSGTTEGLAAVWVAPDGTGFAGGAGHSGPTILRFDGSEWSPMATGVTGYSVVYGIWGTSSTNVYAVGSGPNAPMLLHYNGSNWTSQDVPLAVPPDFVPFGVWGSSPEDVFAVGNAILHSNGTIWALMDSSTGGRSVWGSSGHDVYAAGGGTVTGAVAHYDGVRWRPVNLGLGTGWNDPLHPVRGIWGSSSRDVFLVTEGGQVVHFDGRTWSLMQSMTSQQLLGVWGRADDDVFAVGWNGRVQHYGTH